MIAWKLRRWVIDVGFCGIGCDVMPWYSHPNESWISGFWDGQQWLVAEAEQHVMIGGDWVAIDDIAEVSYGSSKIYSMPGGPMRSSGSYITRQFSITDRHGRPMELDLGVKGLADDPERRFAWEGLVDISRRRIEPRIAQRIFDSLAGGGQYSINGFREFVSLSRDGFTARLLLRTKKWGWADFDRVDINPCGSNLTLREGERVRIRAKSATGSRSKLVTGFYTRRPNAVVLGTLLPMCAAAFGRGVLPNPEWNAAAGPYAS